MNVYKGMLRPWNRTKAEIEILLKKRELEFVKKDNINPKLTLVKYLKNTCLVTWMRYFSVISRICYRSGY
jgi:hypothetical protein